MKQTVRIIGGQFRGKKITFPAVDGLRPTPDRVRETIFNWLMHTIRGARCLDAFSGSGAMGFEALSRGAGEVVMVEKSPIAYQQLKKNQQSFHSTAITLIQEDALNYLEKCSKPFDIIFLDPPFSLSLIETCLKRIKDCHALTASGTVIIESPNPVTIKETEWQIIKEKKAGLVYYGLLQNSPFMDEF